MKTETIKASGNRDAQRKKGSSEQTAEKKPPAKYAEPCLFCGKPTYCRDYIINPGAGHELPSCSEECFAATKEFVDYDKRRRTLFYMVLLVLVVGNLFFLGFETATRWKYLPMLGIAAAVEIWPLVFTRFERYQKFGIRNTKKIIRVFAAALAVFSLILMITY